jgi:hypothetical protein
MISKNVGYSSSNIGNLSLSIQPLIENLLSFIDTYLPTFINSVDDDSNPEEEIERILNQQLVDFFNGHSSDFNPYLEYKFLFRKDDESRDTLSKPDIGVTVWDKQHFKARNRSFFQIECKRLPTPNISSERSEKEYVRGIKENSGGIERFKNNKHGQHLGEGALIAFIQKESLETWIANITDWVQHEIDHTKTLWKDNDHLVNIYKSPSLHKYSSVAERVSGDTIKLYHFLLDVSGKTIS